MTGALSAIAGAASGVPLSVSVSPTSVSGTYDSEISSGFTGTVNTTVLGGVSPYTMVWTKVSGATFTVLPNINTTAPIFKFNTPTHQVAVYRVTVTDHIGQTATADVSITAN